MRLVFGWQAVEAVNMEGKPELEKALALFPRVTSLKASCNDDETMSVLSAAPLTRLQTLSLRYSEVSACHGPHGRMRRLYANSRTVCHLDPAYTGRHACTEAGAVRATRARECNQLTNALRIMRAVHCPSGTDGGSEHPGYTRHSSSVSA
jgi:hypothetical protein